MRSSTEDVEPMIRRAKQWMNSSQWDKDEGVCLKSSGE